MDEKKMTDEELKQAFFILRHGSDEELSAYLKAVLMIEREYGRQKGEVERLTEENGQLKGYNSGLEYENAELQKQVDELKGKVKDQQREVRMARGFCIHEKRRTESAKALATCKNKIGLAEQKRQYKRGYDKAVKDTAKEIYGLAVMYYDGSEAFDWFLQNIKERYGVEVE